MENPDLYLKTNSTQRRDNKNFLNEFFHLCQWHKKDSLLDIGTATGDTLIDLVLPLLQNNYSHVVGLDISKKMVKFATEYYKKYDRVSFVEYDIESNIEEIIEHFGRFQHTTSFYCLHWIQNQKKAFKNFYNLLVPGGDCLVLFVGQHPFFEIYKILANQSQWKPYSVNVPRAISPYNDSKDPVSDLKEIMSAAGFKHLKIELKKLSFEYENMTEFRDFIYAVSPFSAKIPTKELQKKFFLEFFELARNTGLVTISDENEEKIKICNNYSMLAAYGKK